MIPTRLTNIIRFHFCLQVLLSLPVPMHLQAHYSQTSEDIKWLIDLHMDKDIYKKMKKANSEFVFQPSTMSINGLSVEVEEMHTRGKTTLNYWRKSYTVSLKKPFSFSLEKGVKELPKFYLISMSLDQYYFHNRLAFQCLRQLGVFPLFYHYTELRINGKSEGLYLIVQRPVDYALDDLRSPGILRRGSTDYIVKEKFAKPTDAYSQEKCKETFKEIKASTTNLKGEALFQYLSARLDLESYFSWLAFNYLVRNGDYTDELFYYIIPGLSELKFGIIPWDFDDILAQSPHEGKVERDRQFDRQLLFSSEDKLDRTIARDPYLYAKYLAQIEISFSKLTDDSIHDIFQDIKADLRIYYQDPAIIAISSHDLNPVISLDKFEDELEKVNVFMKARWRQTMLFAESQLTKLK